MNDHQPSKLLQQVASNIRGYMKLRNVGQRGLERLCGDRAKQKGISSITQAGISQIVNEKSYPATNTLDLLAGALGTRAWQLLFPGRAECADVPAAKLDKWVAAYLSASPEDRKVMDRLIDGLNL